MMKDVISFTADEILSIPTDAPEKIFSGDADKAKQEYKRLVSKWHPDQNANVDDDVIAHVNVLYDLAKLRLALGDWVTPGLLSIKSESGKTYELKYRSKRDFELGEIFIGNKIIAYSFYKENEDLFKIGVDHLRNVKFADSKMETEFKKLFPKLIETVSTSDRVVAIFSKTADQLFLSDVLDHFNGKIDPKHVAWIISRLYNLVCFMKYSGLVFSGLTLDACLISPEFHTVSLPGGWWYTTRKGTKLTALPINAVNFGPDDMLDSELSDPRVDLEMIKAIGRELLGDINGSKLLMDKSIPAPMLTGLRQAAGDDAFKEYDMWQNKVLIDSFGPRRFTELKLTADDLYGDD